MSELSLKNIKQITLDIKRQNITVSGLAEDLIDHICCDIETEMDSGITFSEAYKKVKLKIGQGRIREIHEETLYAIDSKYRNMKNLMKISGVAGTTILAISALMKMQHLPWAGYLLTLGALLLGLFFLPSSLTVLWKETHSKKSLLLFISAFLAGFLFIFGTLFKIQHWPGAGQLLILAMGSFSLLFIPALLTDKFRDPEKKEKRPLYIVASAGGMLCAAGLLFKIQHWPAATIIMISGMIITCLVALPWYTWFTWKTETQVDTRFIFIICAIMLIILPGALISLNLQNRFDRGFYSALGKQQLTARYQLQQNLLYLDQYRDSSCYPVMKQLSEKTGDLVKLAGRIGFDMISASSGEDKPSENQGSAFSDQIFFPVSPAGLSSPFTSEPVRVFLFPGTEKRKELEKALAEYRQTIGRLTSEDTAQHFAPVLEPSVYLPSDKSPSGRTSMLTSLHSLELLMNSVLAVEAKVQTIIASRQ